MKNAMNNEPNWQELLREYEMPPSPGVWERIEAAQPAPVRQPAQPRAKLWWSAAAIMGVALVAGYFLWENHGNDAPEALEIMVPLTGNVTSPHDVTDPATISETAPFASPSSMESEVNNPEETRQPAMAPAVSGTPAAAPVATPVSLQGSQPSKPEVLPHVKPVTIPEPKQVTLTSPTAATSQTQAGKTEAPTATPTSNATPERLKVFIPNAFSPGSAGTNAVFKPVIQDNEPVFEYKMQVFSRSGQLLFESNAIEEGWDGRFRGMQVEDRVCVYDITFRDKDGVPYRKWGTVVVINSGM